MTYAYAGLFLIGIFISFFHMLRVRRERGLGAADALTDEDRTFILAGMFLGGIIIPTLIYYFGWKNRFPGRTGRVRKLGWVCLGVYAALLIGGYAYSQYVAISQAPQDTAAQNSNQVPQGATETQQGSQNASLASGATTVMSGAGYSIAIPDQWVEDTTYETSGSGYFTKVWSTADLSQAIALGWTDQTDPNTTELRVETTVLGKVSSGEYALTHPAIAGAAKADLIVSQAGAGNRWDGYLFVHASGANVYEIQGTLLNSTPSDISAMTQLLLSFKLAQ